MKVEATQTLTKNVTPLVGYVANSEVMLLSFLAEKSLSFSLTSDISESAKILAKNEKALDKLPMHSTVASYKLRFEVAKMFQGQLYEDLKKYFSFLS